MLNLGKVERSRIAYYFDTTEPDRAGLVEAQGRWLGSLLGPLGIGSGAVSERDLRAVLDGIDPTSGEILDSRHHRVRVVAFDAVFAAPKSVSVLHALGAAEASEEVRRAHETSVEAVFDYLETNVALVRRVSAAGRTAVAADGLVAASFLHRTSRAPDPHLDSHVVIANLSVDDSGRWSALDARALFQYRRAAGALYGAGLRRELSERLGVTWHRRGHHVVDLVGLSDSVLKGFSRRQAEIEAEMARSGATGAVASRRISTFTRPPKDRTTAYRDLVTQWRERAYRLGVSDDRLSMIGSDRDAFAESDEIRRDRVEHAVVDALEGFDGPFLRRQLVADTARGLVDGARVAEVERGAEETLSSARVVDAVGVQGRRRREWTSVPSPRPERRYLSGETGARLEYLAAAYSDAPSLDLLLEKESSNDRAKLAGPIVGLVVDRDRRRGALESLELLRRIALEAGTSGRRVVGVAAYDSLAGHLEALTGIESVEAERLSFPRHDELLVVFGTERLGSHAAVGLIERARNRGSGVLVFEPGAERDRSRPLMADRLPPTPIAPAFRQHDTPFGTVTFAPALAALPAAIERARRAVEERGRHAVVVSAEHGLGAEIGGAVLAPGAARRLAAQRADVELVVIGGARVIGARRRIDVGEQHERGHEAVAHNYVAVLGHAVSDDAVARAARALVTPASGRAVRVAQEREGRAGERLGVERDRLESGRGR